MSASAAFALALHQLDGVGRVTAGRLLAHFDAYEALRRYPREQVLTRIQGAPKAEAIVKRLFDDEVMRPLLDAARTELADLQSKRITLLTPHHPAWPSDLDALPRSERPALLYAFGRLDVLRRPLVALLARPPLASEPFERAQALLPPLTGAGCVPATGAAHGFDVVVHKRASGASALSVLGAHCGLAGVPRTLPPAVSQAVRAGGLLLSPFPMQHGPFDHDDRLRALLLTALADASVFVQPRPDTPEREALAWAHGAGRPAFALPRPDATLPEGVSPLDEAGFDTVCAAASARAEDRR